MLKFNRSIIAWILVILWMALIFYLSHQPATQSRELSRGVARVVIEMTNRILPQLNLNVSAFNSVLRKMAHFLVYLVLGVLSVNALTISGVAGRRRLGLALAICVLYAVSDEVHQAFVPGRGAQVSDVVLDSAGALAGIGLWHLWRRIKASSARGGNL